ncbi:MAG TPA: tRNA (N(6)-L-threonylcarbamoyladenosine(37)-C(2))-methylthiotransferase MtaB, partial [bacterium]
MTTLPTPKRAALHSMGCRLNHAETQLIRQRLEAAGYAIVDWAEGADVMVLNSCTVTAQADAKSRQALRSARRRNPEARLAIVGCYAQLDAARIAQQGLADVIVGSGDKLGVTELLAAPPTDGPVVAAGRISKAPFAFDTFVVSDGGTRAHLKVQDGCDFMCTFCVIPAARGRSRPRQLDNLLAEAESLAQQGAQEIVLTGVNVGTYDHDGATLLEVVDRLNALSGIERIRISSIEPTTVQAPLLERMADTSHKLVPFLHLPVQSGSEDVLAAMRRRYTAAEYRAFAEHALRMVPDLCLGTDVMVGFPGESDEAFGETFALLSSLPFAYFHVFPYSERNGTAAVRMGGSVPVPTRQRRADVLRALSDAKRLEFHRAHLGRTMPVLFEKPSREDVAEGYTANYIRVQVPYGEAATLRNQLRTVRLLEAGTHHVAGLFEADLPLPNAGAASS